MPEPVLVGIDIGTSAVKACTLGASGAAQYRSVRRPVRVDGHGDQMPGEVWQAVVECLHEVLGSDAVGERGRVLGVGLSGHGPSLVAVDADGLPVSGIITWMDPRPVATAGAVGPTFEATAEWLERLLGKGISLLQPKDYIALRLTGQRCMDASAFSCTAWARPRDGADDGGGDGGGSGVSAAVPQVVEAWEPVGEVTRQAAAATGLTAGAMVAAGGIDAFVEALGAGIIEPGAACDSTGTSTCISTVCNADDSGAVRHVVPGMGLCVEPVTASGSALAWAMSVLMPEAGGVGSDWTAVLADVAARTGPGAGGLTFIPHMTGPRSEWHGPRASGAFVGLRAWHTKFDMVRAVLEGCAYSIRECVERRMPWGVDEFRAVGSGARHDAWLQIKADVLRRPVVRMAIQEGALAGAVLLAGMASGVFGGAREGVEAVVRAGRRFEPAEASDAYEAGYRAFCEAERELGR